MFRYFILIVAAFALVACSVPETKPLKRQLHAEGGMLAAAISSNAKLSVVSGHSTGIQVWDLVNERAILTWRHQGDQQNTVALLAISDDQNYVLSADMDTFALWNLQSGEPEGFWRIDESTIRDIAVSDNGRGILVARGNGKVMFFEPQSGRRLEFLGHQEKVNSVAMSPNGYYALTGGNDYSAYLWDTRSGQVIHAFNHPSRVTQVALDSLGRYAFTADSQKQATIWNVQTGEVISQLSYIQRQRIFTTALFSPEGRYLLTGSPTRRVSLWRVEDGSLVQEWLVSGKQEGGLRGAVVYALGFVDDHTIISESSSGYAEVWAVENQ